MPLAKLVLQVLLVALVLIPGSSCSREQERAASGVQVLDYGIYDAAVILSGSRALGQTPSIVSVEGVKHSETTDTAHCKDGVYFGYRFNPATLPNAYRIRLRKTHPPFRLPSGETETESDETHEVTAEHPWDGEVLWFFLEGFEYEFVPGKWHFQVWIDDDLVGDQVFNVQNS